MLREGGEEEEEEVMEEDEVEEEEEEEISCGKEPKQRCWRKEEEVGG